MLEGLVLSSANLGESESAEAGGAAAGAATGSSPAQVAAHRAASKLISAMATGMLKDAAPGSSFTISSASVSVSLSRTAWPPPQGPAATMATASGLKMSVAFGAPATGPPDPNGTAFAVSNDAPALQGLSSVDAVLAVFEVNPLGPGQPMAGVLTKAISPLTSFSLLAGGQELAVKGSKVVSFDLNYDLATYTAAELACGGPHADCDAATEALQANVSAVVARCQRLAKGALFGSTELNACISYAKALDANLTAHVATCTALPAPCNGRGNCTEAGCNCTDGWSGAQCDSQSLCKYW
jgi:hypothetical protein